MVQTSDEPTSPALANAIVVIGFVAVFLTFAIDSLWPAVIGVVLVLAGGLWAGTATTTTGETGHGHLT